MAVESKSFVGRTMVCCSDGTEDRSRVMCRLLLSLLLWRKLSGSKSTALMGPFVWSNDKRPSSKCEDKTCETLVSFTRDQATLGRQHIWTVSLRISERRTLNISHSNLAFRLRTHNHFHSQCHSLPNRPSHPSPCLPIDPCHDSLTAVATPHP